MKIIDIINQLSSTRMEFQAPNGSVLNTFVVPFFIDQLDLRKRARSLALAGSRGSGKSTYVQYFSHSTRFDQSLSAVSSDEFDCILIYWKPDITYCQGLKQGWLGVHALHFFSLHAALSLIGEIAKLIKNVDHHFPDLIPSLNNSGIFWQSICKVTKQQINSIADLENWLRDYQYQVSTRLNPLNIEGLLSIEPKYVMSYLIDSLRHDYPPFKNTSFKIYIDEFELLSADQQKLINTYRKESTHYLNWNVAYKLNSRITRETSSDQWLQDTDDFVEENLDSYIGNDYDLFAAEVFILTLQNAGLKCELEDLTPQFLGNKDNISLRKDRSYRSSVLDLVKGLMPTPTTNDLTNIALAKNTISNKLKLSIDKMDLPKVAKKHIIENEEFNSLALTILGTFRQRNFDPDLIKKYVSKDATKIEQQKVLEKIHTYEFNTLLSLNLQNTSVQIPLYAGFDRFITMSSPNIRHFKELCLSALKQSECELNDSSFQYIEEINISPLAMHLGAIYKSISLVKEVTSYPPHGNKLSQMVNRIGELFKISQKSLYQTEPERNIFTFPYDYAGSDKDLENFIDSALSWRVLVVDESKRIKDDMQITSKEYQLNPIYAPMFGISYRKKRGIKFSLIEFKTIVTGTTDDFESIKKNYQKKWKATDSDITQGLLEL